MGKIEVPAGEEQEFGKAALGNLGRLFRSGSKGGYTPQDIDNIPFMDEAPDTGERVVVQYGEER
ncbi:hypothetical protein, partial [Anaplasma marginale]|uniref:hypothetical protein n=1 Tax=Anaplasma marginale TaxID=770 RepID=UPI0030B915D0